MKATIYFIALLSMLAMTACTQPMGIKSPAGYDLGKPEVFTMPSALQEISGIAFNNGNADTLYAEQDEEGKVFILKPGDKEAKTIKFGKRGDYEDIGMYKDTLVLLRSDGTIYLFSMKEVDGDRATNVTEIKGQLPAGEYEALYVDEQTGKIYILCKECSGSKKTKEVNGYILSLSATGDISGTGFSLDEKQVEAITGIKTKLKPSALSKNKQTGEWYILSSVNKMLLVADASWNIKNIYPLQPASVFLQPEGIAFDRDHNLYISNEGAGVGAGTLLKFAYKKNN